MSTSDSTQVIARMKEECGLNPEIFDEATRLGACYYPDIWYRAVAIAGNLLRKNFPGTYLAIQTLPEDIYGQEPNFPQTVLRNIINSSLGGESDTQPSASFPGKYMPAVEACANAEGYFGFALQIMDIVTKLSTTHPWRRSSGWAILTSCEQPAGFIKGGRIPSFMSVEPIAVDGITFPAGSLFGAELEKVQPPKAGERLCVTANQVKTLRFRRLTAFALPPNNRRDIFREVDFNDPTENWSMTQIRDAVKKALGSSVQRV